MDRELDYIKLKVDWYKSIFPWILAMIVGAVSLIGSVDPNHGSRPAVLKLLYVSVIFLIGALVFSQYASLALIHRLEKPYKTKSRLLNLLLWMPHGPKWEIVCATLAAACLTWGLMTFIFALAVYRGIDPFIFFAV